MYKKYKFKILKNESTVYGNFLMIIWIIHNRTINVMVDCRSIETYMYTYTCVLGYHVCSDHSLRGIARVIEMMQIFTSIDKRWVHTHSLEIAGLL